MSVKNMEFQAETRKILHLVTHSLYSNRDVFLRELISNASDALEKARLQSLTNLQSFTEDLDWRIEIIPDKTHKTLTISDNGIGMTEEEMIQHLGVIAMSGTQAFLEAMKKSTAQNPGELIGQFGVGFYSAFMVANHVRVLSRVQGSSTGVQWESKGEDSFSIDSADKQHRGTDVILYLNEECLDYLEEWKIRELIQKYSNYIEFPIVMDIEREDLEKDAEGKPKEGAQAVKRVERETLNSQQAIWLKNKADISEKDYEVFYQHLANDYNKPLTHIHYKVEGTTEFSALLYIPAQKPFTFMHQENIKNNIHLYVKRVFILKNSEALLPEYFRFISGVVDSSDLSLNVSREILQENKVIRVIRNSLISKVLNTLADLKKEEPAKYQTFFEHFGHILKEGVYTDRDHQELLLDLLVFRTTKTTGNEYIGLHEYIDRMQPSQKDIYFLPGESEKELEHVSHLEIFRDKGYEVLYFTDPIDEIMMQVVSEHKGKKFQSIIKGDFKLDAESVVNEAYQSFNEHLQKHLHEYIKEVRLSNRLVSSACCLVNDEHSMSIHMEKLMKSYNQDVPKSKRILEINPKHAVIEKMKSLFDANKDDAALQDYIGLLYDQALIMEGSKVPDPQRFVQRFSALLLK